MSENECQSLHSESYYRLLNVLFSYEGFTYMYVCVRHVCCPQKSKEGIGSPGTGVATVSHHVGAGSLEESVFPSSQLLAFSLKFGYELAPMAYSLCFLTAPGPPAQGWRHPQLTVGCGWCCQLRKCPVDLPIGQGYGDIFFLVPPF